jgi:membrane-bound ClpP family serine protease
MIDDEIKNENEENNNKNINNKNINNDDILIEEISTHQKNNELETINKKIINSNENNSYDFNNNSNDINVITNNNFKNENKFMIPPTLKKTFFVSITLLLVGIVLIILGFIQSIATATPGGGIMFWVLGGIVLIPGGFYSFLFYKAKRTTDEYERDEIFGQIPEL